MKAFEVQGKKIKSSSFWLLGLSGNKNKALFFGTLCFFIRFKMSFQPFFGHKT